MAQRYKAAFGQALTFYIDLLNLNADGFQSGIALGALVTVSKDGGVFNPINTAPTEIVTSGVYQGTLSATEMQAQRIIVRIVDTQATPRFAPQTIVFVTEGDPAAQFPGVVVDSLSANGQTGVQNAVEKANGKLDSLYQALMQPLGELTALPSVAGATAVQMVRYLYHRFRNKRATTNTLRSLFRADGTTVLGTSTLADDGTTYTETAEA